MRSTIVSLALILCLTHALLGEQTPLRELTIEDFKWKSRLILLAAPFSEDQSLIKQKSLLAGEEEGLVDRDLKVLELIEHGESRVDKIGISRESVAKIRKNLEVPTGKFQILLIGKDGTAKLRSAKPVSAESLFSLIDTMPMRQREMREGRQN